MTQISDLSASHVRKEMQSQGLAAQMAPPAVAEVHKSSHGPPFNPLDTLSAVSASYAAPAERGQVLSSSGGDHAFTAAARNTQRQTIGSDQTPGRKTTAAVPPPLKLPKRFSASKQGTECKHEPGLEHEHEHEPEHGSQETMYSANGNQFPARQQYYANPVPQGFPSADHLQYPLQQVRPLQPYQHTFYNPQTGTLVSLPVSAPAYPYANVAAAPQIQQPVVLMPVRQQTYYTRAANGQLIPVALPTLPAVAGVGNNPQPQQRGQCPAPAKEEEEEEESRRKKQKTSKPSSPAILKAEQLQRQHIQRQTMLYPNLHQQVQSPNVSDIYQTNDESVNSVGSGEENYDEEPAENGVKLEALNTAETSPTMGTTPIMVTGQEAVEKQPKLQKITGTVTLGAFTYKYSQALSGDPAKDRELFDCLTDNAWKSCMAKR